MRHCWPLSVAVVNADYFKPINDTYGHAVGDAALLSLTRVIQSQIRNGDVFARYAG
jgi:diguanylate cyclase (GGDEF)-like protein